MDKTSKVTLAMGTGELSVQSNVVSLKIGQGELLLEVKNDGTKLLQLTNRAGSKLSLETNIPPHLPKKWAAIQIFVEFQNCVRIKFMLIPNLCCFLLSPRSFILSFPRIGHYSLFHVSRIKISSNSWLEIVSSMYGR